MFAAGKTAAATAAAYIEDVFSTYLYTGNGTSQTITNGVDLSTYGGLVWIKNRGAAQSHGLSDTARGAGNWMSSDLTVGNIANNNGGVSAFTSSGFSVNTSDQQVNGNNNTYASWTFREQPKFFDVVTYTGNGGANNVVNHSLAASIGMLVIKRTDSTGNWSVFVKESGGNYSYWNSSGTGTGQGLNGTGAATGTNYSGFNAYLTTTSFDAAQIDGSNNINANGASFVAYLFASSNSGGFGLSGSDNVISCGSFTTDGSGNATVTLGYEPQWVMIKASSTTSNWFTIDNMRGFSQSQYAYLLPNTSGVESSSTTTTGVIPTATGFTVGSNFSATNTTYIYIAIRRGPMKTPTTGTSVFTPIARTGTRAAGSVTGIGFPPDNLITLNRTPGGYQPEWNNKLVGPTKFLKTATTAAEATSTDLASYDQDGVSFNATDFNSIVNLNSPLIQYFMRRAPGFFDVVCYTGTGSNTTQTHNLGVVPEMMIFKRRDTTANWRVYHSSQPASDLGILNSTSFFQTDTNVLNSTAPTASVFTVGTNAQTNASGGTYVAYLFATVAGVSKVGSYTGTGTTKQIDCGFTGGARFVLIKRVDDSGDWYVWDSARGIVAGNDPYLLLNSTAAEVTGTDYVDTLNAGFEISSTAPAAINANGGTFIFLAIA